MSLPRRGLGWQPNFKSAPPRHALPSDPTDTGDFDTDQPSQHDTGRWVRQSIATMLLFVTCGVLAVGVSYVTRAEPLTAAPKLVGQQAAAPQTPAADTPPLTDANADSVIAAEQIADDLAGKDPAEAPQPTTQTTAPETAAPAAPALTTRMQYVTTAVRLRSQANTDADILATLPGGTQLTSVGEPADGWQQVSSPSGDGFVSAQYLSDTPPATTAPAVAPAASSYPACASGSRVEAGLTARAVNVHRAVCSTFNTVTGYGGYRAGSAEHGTGRAIDIMVTGANGRVIAEWLRANSGTLGVTEVIYQQRIWTVQRSREGWRAMPNRGGATANHFDHIHVLVR